MKRFFIGAAFFWACTFTQQAQHSSFESQGENKAAAWSNHLIASGEKSHSAATHFSTPAYDGVLAMED
jgi:hypothetical protein